MTESRIRSIIRELCEELDRTARRLGKVALPTALGAGLAVLGGCGDDGVAVKPDSIRPDAYVPRGEAMYAAPFDAKVDAPVSGPDAAYGVPDLIKKSDQALKDQTIKHDHALKDQALKHDQALKDQALKPDMKTIDSGGVLLYMPPFTDKGPTPPYMAPDAE